MVVALLLTTALSFTLEIHAEPHDAAQMPVKRRPPLLLAIPAVRSRSGLPAGYDAAREMFDAAQQDHANGAPERAAVRFMSVAVLLRAPRQPAHHSGQLARMRQVSYTNAATCFAEAELPDAARQALVTAMKDDPENEAVLRKLLAEIK